MWIIALDGSKGAGKSTLVTELLQRYPQAKEVSLDKERRAQGYETTSFEINETVFETMKPKIDQLLSAGNDIIVDCGLNDIRINALHQASEKHHARLELVFLTAPYDVLLQRVEERSRSQGRSNNRQRFEEVYKLVNDKDLSDFAVLDSAKLDPKELANAVEKLITS